MLRYLLLLILLIVNSFTVRAEDARDPLTLIRSIYGAYTSSAEGPDLDLKRLYSHRLKALVDADEKATPAGEVGALDFDVFVDGQDWKLSKVKIFLMSKSSAHAKVRATFVNFKNPEEIVFDLVEENDQWHIDEVSSMKKGRRWVLSKIFSRAPDAFPDEAK
ncbi:MAG: DUF3828 domain-containing protein [Hyphomicrobiales bacterium]|nr:DUF3828 domain-containing protein [Hyphomicrobiales bacterium]